MGTQPVEGFPGVAGYPILIAVLEAVLEQPVGELLHLEEGG